MAEAPAGEPDPLEAVSVAAAAADAKLGVDTIVLEVGDVLGITGWFVVTSAANARQVKTIVDEVERRVREECGIDPLRIEGRDARRWVLIDYGDFVVHVFDAEQREYYGIERLWSDVPRRSWHSTEDTGDADEVERPA